MNQLYLLFGFGAVLLGLFVFAAAARAFRPVASEAEAVSSVSVEFLSLPGLTFSNSQLLFDRGDYEFLCSAPALVSIAQDLLRDRKRLVGEWLKLMQHDVLTMWRFRRFLSAHGVSTGTAEELAVAASAVTMLFALVSLRIGVTLVGPFALVDLLQGAPLLTESIRQACARGLAQLPDSRLAEVRSAWLAA